MKRDSISNRPAYLSACKLAVEDENVFKQFKRLPAYKAILEHVSQKDGHRYLDIVKDTAPELLEKWPRFHENDLQGNPLVFRYTAGLSSPTTLRYIKVAADLKILFGSLDGMDVVEIGCGYGGQSKIICEAFNINSYTYIDLPNVVDLIEKYTGNILADQKRYFIKTDDLNNKIKNKYDLVISNYAFSECIPKAQNEYIDSVINKSENGYLTCNFINHIFGLDSLTREQLEEKIIHDMTITKETPNTFNGNLVMSWSA